MSLPASLLRSAVEMPEEDAPRLVLADWLEEEGSSPGQRERGEFIRVQCELACWVPELERRTALLEREQALLAAWRAEWLGGPRAPWKEGVFERGLAQVTIEARRFAARAFAARKADWLTRAGVERVRLLRPGRSLEALRDCPALAEVTSLDLGCCELDDEAALALLSCSALSRLRCLDLSNNDLTTAFATRLAEEAGKLPHLIRLDLRNNVIEDEGLRALLDSPLGGQLRWLEFHGNDYQPHRLAGWRNPLTGATTRSPVRLINSIGLELALIPPGTFRMGSPDDEPERFDNEGPQHRVTLTRPFWVGVYPVTQAQYQAVRGANPSRLGGAERARGHFPVDSVSWEEAHEFCERLSEMPEEKKAGRIYRLPTEAEWEYACRAGTTTPFSFGATACGLEGNFGCAAGYQAERRVRPLSGTTLVGRYAPNAFGLFDMHGNVQEWVADWYEEYSAEARVDPTGPEEGEMKVLRGGSWFVNVTRCRSARRNRFYPTSGNDNYGFRVALHW